jgi:hypothetical protein
MVKAKIVTKMESADSPTVMSGPITEALTLVLLGSTYI